MGAPRYPPSTMPPTPMTAVAAAAGLVAAGNSVKLWLIDPSTSKVVAALFKARGRFRSLPPLPGFYTDAPNKTLQGEV